VRRRAIPDARSWVGYGLVVNLRIPAAGKVQLYQPSYRLSYDLP
jgi:hypothetical protein